MGFNPFKEKGIPIEKQTKPWVELNVKPYDSSTVDPYTRLRGILMNGIEAEAVQFYHNFHRHIDIPELRAQLATLRRIEQQEQKMVNWMIPAEESTLQVTIGYEQLAVDLTAALAQAEQDPYVKAALDFALLEDFDHLYRYANLLAMTDEKKAESIVKQFTEIIPGRPTVIEHCHPVDTVRNFTDRSKTSAQTKLHIETIIAAEQQTMNFYMNIGNRLADQNGRGLYQEIAQIEEQHVTHYGSLTDPRASWFEMAVLHEYNECYMYYSCMQSETDDKAKGVWQMCLENELTHLQTAAEIMKKYENKDPEEMFPDSMPEPIVLKPAKEYVRSILSSQLHYTGDKTKMVPLNMSESQDRYQTFLTTSNDDFAPSQKVVQDCINSQGEDYRVETEGPHPADILLSRRDIPDQKSLLEFCKNR
ncbi:hypothetical protein QA601_17465 [Chitinispirillales bacterium ANBcel5]|uniref:hypothetical protein n=1 Tax=Cellulosispirillum alkaliphilum TaxID=3039283 RepID=UPI002A4F6ECC|nr:hypothetical protein [Chitinispirillales bacterium ANBcel5]